MYDYKLKNIMKSNLYILTGFLFVLLVLPSSCTDKIMDDIDRNPNQVNDAPLNSLLPQGMMGYIYEVAGGSGARVTSYMAELHTNVLGMGGIYNTMNSYNSSAWSNGYLALNDLKILKEKAMASESWAYAGIADIITAYALSNLADLYGDIPLREALQAGDIRQPQFDTVQEVYEDVHTLLDNAITNLDKAPSGLIPSNDDLVFQGDMSMWKKTAYALKARLYNRLSNLDPTASANNALAALANAFENPDENFMFTQYTTNPDHENPFSGAQHSQPEFAVGNGIYNAMLSFSVNDTIEDDPRADIWFSRIDGKIVPAPNGTAGGDFGEPRLDGRFYSKPKVLKALDAPQPINTYAELKFIEAEANLRLGNLPEANAAYEEAVTTALQQAALFDPSVGLSEEQIGAYTSMPSVFPGANGLTLEHIILQKYIYFFQFQPIEAFNDLRRLDMLEATDPSGRPNRLPYPDSEISRNPNTPENVNVATIFDDFTKLFWAR